MTSARSTFRTRRPRSRWPCPTQSGWRRNGAIGVALSASGHADQRANPMLTARASHCCETRTRLTSKVAQVLEQRPRRGLSSLAVVVH
jgi:hypothetical protein